MSPLTPNECRVLGVLVEKALTTQSQYPLTLNAVVVGSNQKNNRDPVMSIEEDDAIDALDGLRGKSLAREVMMSGSRVPKFRHNARETLGLETSQLVVVTELLLRGPETLGEIRGRASRMHELESLDQVKAIIDALMQRDPPLVRRVAPAPGSRAERFAQLLCPDLHPLAPAAPAVADARPSPAPAAPADPGLVDRMTTLERTVADLQRELDSIKSALGV